MAVKWLDEPETHDYDAAADYLSLLAGAPYVAATVAALGSAKTLYRKAKDILRAARLSLLSADNPDVRADLDEIGHDKKLSHRVCASYLTDENTPLPCRLVSWAPGA